jgi:hypothetical protein
LRLVRHARAAASSLSFQGYDDDGDLERLRDALAALL